MYEISRGCGAHGEAKPLPDVAGSAATTRRIPTLACALQGLARIPHLRTSMRIRLAFAMFGVLLLAGRAATEASTQARHQLMIRGHLQQLQLYGPDDGAPVVVASGDGGWIHLGPHVAELLAMRGFFVVGFDVKAYLASFTTDVTTLRAAEDRKSTRLNSSHS